MGSTRRRIPGTACTVFAGRRGLELSSPVKVFGHKITVPNRNLGCMQSASTDLDLGLGQWSREDVVHAEDGRELGLWISFLVATLDMSSLCLSF
ncbi:unnamed protein product [Dovyalis caffra]|uniref:Uncharacterized protein n=1 Tax=Dovyalis caffra TaxID=77055 RepID=A0AAV1R7U2_9ROSI|nr:unnamed protein product [Dovyalis caffra]